MINAYYSACYDGEVVEDSNSPKHIFVMLALKT